MNNSSSDSAILALVGERDKKDGDRKYFLEFADSYADRDWRFYEAARTEDADELKFVPVQRKVSACYPALGSCVYSEVYHIYLTEPQFRKAVSGGLGLKIVARNGISRYIQVAAQDASALLVRMDADSPAPVRPIKPKLAKKASQQT